MKRFAMTVLLGLACASYAYAATAPTISVTDSTTTKLTVTFSDSIAGQDSLVLVFSSTAADSDGGGTEYVSQIGLADTTVTGLVPGTLYYLIARVDSQGVKGYSNRDTVRVEYPRQQPENWYSGDFHPLHTAQTWPGNGRAAALDSLVISSTGVDSTMWFKNAPYIGIHIETTDTLLVYLYEGRIVDDLANGTLNNYPRVTLADSQTVYATIDDISFSTNIGSEACYIKVGGITSQTGTGVTSYIWLRRHWFTPEAR